MSIAGKWRVTMPTPIGRAGTVSPCAIVATSLIADHDTRETVTPGPSPLRRREESEVAPSPDS